MLLYLNISGAEWVIVAVALLMVIAVANYGRDTVFGYWGSLLLCFVVSPIVVFLILYIIKNKKSQS